MVRTMYAWNDRLNESLYMRNGVGGCRLLDARCSDDRIRSFRITIAIANSNYLTSSALRFVIQIVAFKRLFDCNSRAAISLKQLLFRAPFTL